MMKKLKKIFKSLNTSQNLIDKLYNKYDYLEAYSKHTDLRVKDNPESAVGGLWSEIGLLQYNFMINSGLKKENTLLDIGCGTLRGGIHFIKYLDNQKYCGYDISEEALKYGYKLIQKEKLDIKYPKLLLNRDKKLNFNEFSEKYDFILAQSVFTHLYPEHIEECFINIHKIMTPNSMFFFTYNRSEKYTQVNRKDFKFPLDFFLNIAKNYGFKIYDKTNEYKHPRNQNMLLAIIS